MMAGWELSIQNEGMAYPGALRRFPARQALRLLRHDAENWGHEVSHSTPARRAPTDGGSAAVLSERAFAGGMQL